MVFALRLIEEDGGSNVAVYNDCLQAGIDADKPWTWFGTSWLFAECYLCVSLAQAQARDT